MGRTQVICTASWVEGVDQWRKGSGKGWVTAEYGMLPASTSSRKPRPIAKPDGRGVEIQRLIGRVLRSVVCFEKLQERTIYLDCDVLQADGGTRTAAINGAYVALVLAVKKKMSLGLCPRGVITGAVAGVSVGIVDGKVLLDLDYSEDSGAQVDMNLAMTSKGEFVELQGTAEQKPFAPAELEKMLAVGRTGIRKLIQAQRRAISQHSLHP